MRSHLIGRTFVSEGVKGKRRRGLDSTRNTLAALLAEEDTGIEQAIMEGNGSASAKARQREVLRFMTGSVRMEST